MKRFLRIAVFLLILASCEKQKAIIPLIYRPDEIAFFNENLLPEDGVAAFAGKSDLLGSLVTRRKFVSGPSVASLVRALESGIDVDYVCYNPETYSRHGTPQEELRDLAGALGRLRPLAEKHDAALGIVPDRFILEEEGEQLAPLVDLFGIQAQRYQTWESKRFLSELREKIERIRHANPEAVMVVQLSTSPPLCHPDGDCERDETGEKIHIDQTAEEMRERMRLIEPYVDGLVLLYTESTLDVMKQLVLERE